VHDFCFRKSTITRRIRSRIQKGPWIRGQGVLFEKNRRSKISWHCPFVPWQFAYQQHWCSAIQQIIFAFQLTIGFSQWNVCIWYLPMILWPCRINFEIWLLLSYQILFDKLEEDCHLLINKRWYLLLCFLSNELGTALFISNHTVCTLHGLGISC
jgi:hypothetical protein